MKKSPTFIFILIVLTISQFIFCGDILATTYTASEFGFDWDDDFSWEGNQVPPNPLPLGDEIIIPQNVSLRLYSSKTIAGALTIDGYLDIRSGGSISNSGTVTLQGGGDIDVRSGGSLSNSETMTISKFSSDLYVRSGGSFTNTGTFNLSPGQLKLDNSPTSLPGGTFNWSSPSRVWLYSNTNVTLTNPFTIPTGTELYIQGTFTNNSTLEVDGSIIFNPNFSNSSGTINLNSGGRLYYDYSGATPPDGTFNWSSGGLIQCYTNCNLTLSSPLTVPSGGTLQIHGIVTNNSTLTNEGIIKTNNSGNRELVQNGTFTNSGSIAPGSSPGRLDVTGNLDLGTGTYNCEINGTGQGTTYDLLAVTGNATLTNANLVVDWGTFTPSAGETFTVMTFGSRGGTQFNSLTIPAVSGIQFTPMYSPNSFSISASLLPVELVAFEAKAEKNKVNLKWSTASELNNAGFHLQRSADGKSWQDLTFIPGYGTTYEEQSYTYTDERPLSGLNYYRLRQVDFDGAFEYSKIVNVEVKEEGNGISLYPNPATGTVSLTLETDYLGEATLSLYDFIGQQVKTQLLWLEGDTFRTDIGLGNLPTGVYLAKIQAGREHWQKQLVVE